MTAEKDHHSVSLILLYCMRLEKTVDLSHARDVAEFCELMHDGKPTADGIIVANLMQANEEVSYSQVKRISSQLEEQNTNSDKSKKFTSPFHDYAHREQIRDYLCETSNNKRWHIAGQKKS